jgi:iron complex outermembrane receptor protein
MRYTADDLNRYGHTVHLNNLGSNPLFGGAYTLDPPLAAGAAM